MQAAYGNVAAWVPRSRPPHRRSNRPSPPWRPDGELVLAEKGGVGVVYIAAPTIQDLVDTNGG